MQSEVDGMRDLPKLGAAYAQWTILLPRSAILTALSLGIAVRGTIARTTLRRRVTTKTISATASTVYTWCLRIARAGWEISWKEAEAVQVLVDRPVMMFVGSRDAGPCQQ